MKPALLLAFVLGVVCGLGFFLLFEGVAQPPPGAEGVDPRHVGLPWAWLAFGFGAQALFMGRMVVQWIATERAKSSVVPAAFWWLSLLGGMMLLIYFLRRGDPVGILGQAFGVTVYSRNLYFIYRRPHRGDPLADDREGR